MVERVLVPVDESETAERACEFVVATFPEATAVLLHVIDPAEAGYSAQAPLPSLSEEWFERERERAEKLLDDVAEWAGERGVETEQIVEIGSPSGAIVEFTEENDADHVVLGSHGREGVSRILLGSVAETVVRRSPVPVTVVR